MGFIEVVLVAAMVAGVFVVAKAAPIRWRTIAGIPLLAIAIVILLLDGLYPFAAFLTTLLIYGGYLAVRDFRQHPDPQQGRLRNSSPR